MNSTRIKTIIRYTIRLVPLVIVVGAVAWFFWFRPSGDQASTSGTTGPEQKTPETTVSAAEPEPPAKPEPSVPDNSDTLAAATPGADGLPQTGPGDMLLLFAAATATGTLLWEWRTHRKHNDH